jgi:hypothetical protein
MKELVEYIGFGNILTILTTIAAMIWHASKFGFRVENLEKASLNQDLKHAEHVGENKMILNELQKIREWQIARDAKESVEDNIAKKIGEGNAMLAQAILSLKKNQ